MMNNTNLSDDERSRLFGSSSSSSSSSSSFGGGGGDVGGGSDGTHNANTGGATDNATRDDLTNLMDDFDGLSDDELIMEATPTLMSTLMDTLRQLSTIISKLTEIKTKMIASNQSINQRIDSLHAAQAGSETATHPLTQTQQQNDVNSTAAAHLVKESVKSDKQIIADTKEAYENYFVHLKNEVIQLAKKLEDDVLAVQEKKKQALAAKKESVASNKRKRAEIAAAKVKRQKK
tara:strand:- start:122 stop:820 length:699 start_codon:yes stop_codon:yes gene_type:complete